MKQLHLWAVLVCAAWGTLVSTASLSATSPVGATAGSFKVSEAGAATYSIPIAVSPGIAGMQPSLSLTYSSQGGNGLLGMGWNLGGLSVIHRCPKTVVQDGTKGGINLDANDRYCLDGQRLVAITGAYGAANTEYRTERESYSRIISYGAQGTGPSYWKVWTKSGQVMEYGNSTDSKIEAQGKTEVMLWALNKVQDTVGNYLTVTYTEDNANGQYYPTRIDYTGNANTGKTPSNSIQFSYETRPDITPLYQAGSLMKNTVRMSKVQSYAGATLTREYRLAYNQSAATQRSRVATLTECTGDGVCLPSVNFGWQEGGPLFERISQLLGDGYLNIGLNSEAHKVVIGDFNGDGKADFFLQAATLVGANYILLADVEGKFTAINQSFGDGYLSRAWDSSIRQPIVGDFNGDGRTDVFFQSKSASSPSLMVLSDSEGKFTSISQVINDGYLGWGWDVPSRQAIVGDFNGDGRTDIFFQSSSASSPSLMMLSDGAGHCTSITQVISDGYLGRAWDSSIRQPIVGDFNGDGRTDVFFQSKSASSPSLMVLSDSEGKFTSISQVINDGYLGWGWDVSSRQAIVGDFNGDGRTDIFFQSSSASSPSLMMLSDGAGHFTSITQVISDGYLGRAWDSSIRQPIVGDFNGDGRTDIFFQSRYASSPGLVVDSDSAGRFTTINQTVTDGYLGYGWEGKAHPTFAADMNGDGRTDLFFQNVDTSSAVFSVFSNDDYPFPDLLTTLTTGLGAVTTVTYKPLTDNTVYTKDTTALYPYLDLQVPLYVVSRVTNSDGIGGAYAMEYSYTGAKAHLQGGGYLGFKQVTAHDPQTGIKSSSVYRQDYPYAGLPLTSEKRTDSGVLLNQATNTYSNTLLNPTASPVYHQSLLTMSVEQSYELNGSLVTTVTTNSQYDAYGNPTQIVVSTGDGYSKTTNNTYDNTIDSTRWFLGRLKRSTVTSVTP